MLYKTLVLYAFIYSVDFKKRCMEYKLTFIHVHRFISFTCKSLTTVGLYKLSTMRVLEGLSLAIYAI